MRVAKDGQFYDVSGNAQLEAFLNAGWERAGETPPKSVVPEPEKPKRVRPKLEDNEDDE